MQTTFSQAIKEEDKAKQAVGGVQLTRLSFPPTPETDTVIKIIEDSVAAIYA
jgi:cysteine synthase A